MRTLAAGGGKRAGSAERWAKIKFDRQIMSVARVIGAAEVYSDDGGIHSLGQQLGVRVIRLADLPLPPEDPQGLLPLD